jgi:hypothetical protein
VRCEICCADTRVEQSTLRTTTYKHNAANNLIAKQSSGTNAPAPTEGDSRAGVAELWSDSLEAASALSSCSMKSL